MLSYSTLASIAMTLAIIACHDNPKSLSALDPETLAPEMRGSESKRNIRRYLECKGLRCEDLYPEAAEAVESRSAEFKDVWDTLALTEDEQAQAGYAERLKPRKRMKR